MKYYRFVDAEKANHSIAILCRVLQAARAGYYAWLRRRPSRHAEQDAQLQEEIREIHAGSRGTYGTPRIHATLAGRGVHVGRKRVARLMAELHLYCYAGAARRASRPKYLAVSQWLPPSETGATNRRERGV